jgi:hypothetical protein
MRQAGGAVPARRGGRLGLSMSEKISHRPPGERRRVSVNFP